MIDRPWCFFCSILHTYQPIPTDLICEKHRAHKQGEHTDRATVIEELGGPPGLVYHIYYTI
jgi:hypothetical protein